MGVTVVVVTHDAAVADVTDRTIAIRDGRADTERVRVIPTTVSSGALEAMHIEYVVVGRARRMQIPQDYLGVLGFNDRAVVRLGDRRIIIESVRLPVSHERPHNSGSGIGQHGAAAASPSESRST